MTPISPFPLLMSFIFAIVGMFVFVPSDPGHSVFGATLGGSIVGGLLGVMIAYVMLGLLEEVSNRLGTLWFAQHTELRLSEIATGDGTRYIIEKRVRFPVGWGRWTVEDSYESKQLAQDEYNDTLKRLVRTIADIKAQHKKGTVRVLNERGGTKEQIDRDVEKHLQQQYKQEL